MDATTPVVVDTDVVSFVFKTHALAAAYQTILAGRSLAVSLITLAEIEYGMEAKNWGATRRDLMRRFLARFTVLLPDAETARVWARIKSSCDRKGRPVAFADAWIAAAAVPAHRDITRVMNAIGAEMTAGMFVPPLALSAIAC